MAVAKDAGLNEDTIAHTRTASAAGLSDAHRSALALADALMTQPSSLSSASIVELRKHFTDAQLVELTLDTMKWNYQKVSVALGVDDEVRPGELADLIFDADGNWVRPT